MKKKLSLIFLFAFLGALNSHAQKNARPQAVDMSLQIGGTMPSNLGGVLAFPAVIPVLAFSEGVSTGCISPNSCPTPNQQDLSLTVYQTSDFILFRQALLNHTPINLELTSVFSGGDISKVYLEDAYISSISNGGSGGEDRLTVNISIYAPKWDHFFHTNASPTPTHYGWNYTLNTPFSHY